MRRSGTPVSACGLLVVGLALGSSAGAADEAGLEERARELGRRAARELTGEDAVPFVSPDRERKQARKDHPTVRIDRRRLDVGSAELLAWFASPTRGVEQRGLVVVLPGWQSNAGFALEGTAFLLEKGYRLLIMEDRAHAFIGRAEEYRGFIREDVADIQKALDAFAADHDVGSVPLVLYGFSWGGLRALLVAAERPEVKAVIVDAPVPDPEFMALRTFEEYMPPDARGDAVLRRTFVESFDETVESKLGYAPSEIDVEAAVASIAPRPVLFIHGRDDDYVPLGSTRALYQAAKEPKQILVGDRFGHCLGMRRQPDTYVPAVTRFLDDAVGASSD